MVNQRGSVEKRFWNRVDRRGPSECWEWTGCKSSGYGNLGGGRRGVPTERAHRVSWEIHNGPIPNGLWVLHRCDNRSCVNPSHLFLGTIQDNLKDMRAKGRHVHKLSVYEAEFVRMLGASGMVHHRIASLVGVVRDRVSRIIRGSGPHLSGGFNA